MKYFLALILAFTLTTNVYGSIRFPQNETLELVCDTAVLIDSKTGAVLYGKDMNTQKYPASITKVMTALLALEHGNLDSEVFFSRAAALGIEPGSSSIGMKEGEIITLRDALYGLMLKSANEIGLAIAEHVDGTIDEFVNHMNTRAKELGCLNTNFKNPHGLPDEEHLTTAYDMGLILAEAMKHEEFRTIVVTPKYQIGPTNITEEIRYLVNSNALLQTNSGFYYPDCTGGKNGYTIAANQTLVMSAKRGDIELVSVVLKDTKNDRYYDTIKLFEYGFNNFEQLTILDKSTYSQVHTLELKDRKPDAPVILKASQDFSMLLPKGTSPTVVEQTVKLNENIQLPIVLNDELGSIILTYEGNEVGEVSLVAGNSVFPIVEATTQARTEPPVTINLDNTVVTEAFAPSNEQKDNTGGVVALIIASVIIVTTLSIFAYSKLRKQKSLNFSRYRRRF